MQIRKQQLKIRNPIKLTRPIKPMVVSVLTSLLLSILGLSISASESLQNIWITGVGIKSAKNIVISINVSTNATIPAPGSLIKQIIKINK